MILSSLGMISMVRNNLSKLLGERRMTQSQLSMLTGIRPNAISDLYNEVALSIKFDHIDKICEVLQCDLSDLFEYIPNKRSRTGKYLIIEEYGNQKKKRQEK